MKKLLFLILILLSMNAYSQTISISNVYHSGNYTGGIMNPDYDYDISLSLPMTEKIDLSFSVYYYQATYNKKFTSMYWKENYWYVTITFSYTFSTTPIFDR